jgi:hypothetical protein
MNQLQVLGRTCYTRRLMSQSESETARNPQFWGSSLADRLELWHIRLGVSCFVEKLY